MNKTITEILNTRHPRLLVKVKTGTKTYFKSFYLGQRINLQTARNLAKDWIPYPLQEKQNVSNKL